jgi:hypothetical protein
MFSSKSAELENLKATMSKDTWNKVKSPIYHPATAHNCPTSRLHSHFITCVLPFSPARSVSCALTSLAPTFNSSLVLFLVIGASKRQGADNK